MRRASHSTLQSRLLTLVGAMKADRDFCFHCGQTTVLGRMRATVGGKLVASCMRSECGEALKAALVRDLEAFALGDTDA